jgi:hypothetical protein
MCPKTQFASTHVEKLQQTGFGKKSSKTQFDKHTFDIIHMNIPPYCFCKIAVVPATLTNVQVRTTQQQKQTNQSANTKNHYDKNKNAGNNTLVLDTWCLTIGFKSSGGSSSDMVQARNNTLWPTHTQISSNTGTKHAPLDTMALFPHVLLTLALYQCLQKTKQTNNKKTNAESEP